MHGLDATKLLIGSLKLRKEKYFKFLVLIVLFTFNFRFDTPIHSGEAERLNGMMQNTILVRVETSPEDINGMHAAKGILTARGGMTSHAAVVARGMGRPCVSGSSEIEIDYQNKIFKTKNNENRKIHFTKSFDCRFFFNNHNWCFNCFNLQKYFGIFHSWIFWLINGAIIWFS